MLSAHELSIHRGDRCLLDRVNLALMPGEMTVLIGPNGAGKTTLLRALAGELDTARGSIRYGRHLLHALSPLERAQLRSVHAQHQRTDLDYTARQVVELGRYPWHLGKPSDEDRRIAQAAMALTGTADMAPRICSTLSGGEQARVHLARALAQVWTAREGAHALLLDEPVAALDIAWQHRVLRCARDFARARGCAVMAIVHDLNLALRYADRVVLLQSGRIRADGPPESVMMSPELASAFGLNCRVVRDSRDGATVLVAEPA